jgi:hypothetical protein
MHQLGESQQQNATANVHMHCCHTPVVPFKCRGVSTTPPLMPCVPVCVPPSVAAVDIPRPVCPPASSAAPSCRAVWPRAWQLRGGGAALHQHWGNRQWIAAGGRASCHVQQVAAAALAPLVNRSGLVGGFKSMSCISCAVMDCCDACKILCCA